MLDWPAIEEYWLGAAPELEHTLEPIELGEPLEPTED